jgi:uncharacterized membrane-anchored protein
MRKLLLAIALFFAALPAFSREPDDSLDTSIKEIMAYANLMDSVNKALKYETGMITLPSGVIKLNIPKGFKYLGQEQSKYVIEDLWGNLPQENLQGMLFPENSHPFDDSSYAYIIAFSPVGYIKDGDAKDINYDDLLKEMQTDQKEENIKRKQMGLSAMYTQGWAATPYYDEQKKVLHWAVDLVVDGTDQHTLNYRIILLGRKGMLSMNAIASVDNIGMVKADVNKVLDMAQFTEGNRYQDFDSKVDDVAAWTIGGLVAGKVLLKTAAGVGILKFLKFIIAGIVIAGGMIWRWVRGRKKEQELVYEPAPATPPSNDQTPIPGA